LANFELAVSDVGHLIAVEAGALHHAPVW
jgi:hypothetical protein